MGERESLVIPPGWHERMDVKKKAGINPAFFFPGHLRGKYKKARNEEVFLSPPTPHSCR